MSNGDKSGIATDHVWKAWEWEQWEQEVAERRAQADLRFRKRLVLMIGVGVALNSAVALIAKMLA